jgi:hypothetical protein
VGFALFALPGTNSGFYWTTFFPAAVVLGIGLSILVPAVTIVALNSVEGSRSGLASAINNAFSQTGGLLAIAVMGVLMFATFGASLDNRLAYLELSPDARQQLEEEKINLRAATPPEEFDATLSETVEQAIEEALVSGYRVVMLIAAAMAAASAISAALLIEGNKPKQTTEEVDVVH